MNQGGREKSLGLLPQELFPLKGNLFGDGLRAGIQPHGQLSPAKDAVKRRVT